MDETPNIRQHVEYQQNQRTVKQSHSKNFMKQRHSRNDDRTAYNTHGPNQLIPKVDNITKFRKETVKR